MASTDFDGATAVLTGIAGETPWIRSHTRLGFSARHAVIATVRDQFTEFTGTAHVDTASHPYGEREGQDGDERGVCFERSVRQVLFRARLQRCGCGRRMSPPALGEAPWLGQFTACDLGRKTHRPLPGDLATLWHARSGGTLRQHQA